MEFNLKRFGLLLRRRCSVTIRELLMHFLIMLLMCVVIPTLFGKADGMTAVSLEIMFGIYYTVWLARNSFWEYKKRSWRVAAILVPASTFEKYVCEIVYAMVIVPVVLYAGLSLGWCIDSVIAGSWEGFSQLWDLMITSPWKEEHALVLVLSGWAVVFAFFFGSLFFKKFSAAICICTSLLLLIVLIFRMSFLVIAAKDILYGAENWFVQRDFFVTFGNVMSDYFMGLMCVMLVFFVVMTYLRLKEERA